MTDLRYNCVDPATPKPQWLTDEARERLVQERYDAGARGNDLLEAPPGPYRPLTTQVVDRIIDQMRQMFNRGPLAGRPLAARLPPPGRRDGGLRP